MLQAAYAHGGRMSGAHYPDGSALSSADVILARFALCLLEVLLSAAQPAWTSASRRKAMQRSSSGNTSKRTLQGQAFIMLPDLQDSPCLSWTSSPLVAFWFAVAQAAPGPTAAPAFYSLKETSASSQSSRHAFGCGIWRRTAFVCFAAQNLVKLHTLLHLPFRIGGWTSTNGDGLAMFSPMQLPATLVIIYEALRLGGGPCQKLAFIDFIVPWRCSLPRDGNFGGSTISGTTAVRREVGRCWQAVTGRRDVWDGTVRRGSVLHGHPVCWTEFVETSDPTRSGLPALQLRTVSFSFRGHFFSCHFPSPAGLAGAVSFFFTIERTSSLSEKKLTSFNRISYTAFKTVIIHH